MAPTLHSKNGRGNTFFTERRHSEQSPLGLTGSYEIPRIAQAGVRQRCANSILVRTVALNFAVVNFLRAELAALERVLAECDKNADILCLVDCQAGLTKVRRWIGFPPADLKIHTTS